MSFNSLAFLFYFLPLFFLFYGLTPAKYKNMTLLLGSMIFYVYGKPEYLGLLLISACLNYRFGLKLKPCKRKKKHGRRTGKGKKEEKRTWDGRTCLFWLAVAGNVALLCVFKIRGGGMPLGLSFYTFQVISYLADVYRGEIAEEKSFFRFLTYLLMFPKMGCGPITAYADVVRDMEKRRMTMDTFQSGLKTFTLGLAAKILLADRLEILWHQLSVTGFESITWKLAWIGAIAFSMKLYFDFYGYSLMAIGLGEMLGFHLPDNFRTPYLSGSVAEFYRRWHITLGRWFWKYLYVPLGGSRRGEIRTALNLMTVWVVTGFWHGASANFLLWGAFLGACIVSERWLFRIVPLTKTRVLSRLYLWFVIPISWMFFAITDPPQLWIYLSRMFGVGEAVNGNPLDWYLALKEFWGFLLAGMLCCTGVVEWAFRKWKNKLLMNLILAPLFWYCVWRVLEGGNNPFLYLNF